MYRDILDAHGFFRAMLLIDLDGLHRVQGRISTLKDLHRSSTHTNHHLPANEQTGPTFPKTVFLPSRCGAAA